MKAKLKLAAFAAVAILAGWSNSALTDGSEPTKGNTRAVDLMNSGRVERTGYLRVDESKVYVFQAMKGRNLTVRVAAHGHDLHYQILKPDGSALLAKTSAEHLYQGILETSGEYAVEIINRDEKKASFDVILGLD